MTTHTQTRSKINRKAHFKLKPKHTHTLISDYNILFDVLVLN